jgi:MerR family copper efflux transcriptional regulator
MSSLTIGEAARRTGWSPRMLRYLERVGLVAPERTGAAYRVYGEPQVELLRGVSALRRGFDVTISDLAFALRLRREPRLRAELDALLHRAEQLSTSMPLNWLDWEQRKHQRLLAA